MSPKSERIKLLLDAEITNKDVRDKSHLITTFC